MIYQSHANERLRVGRIADIQPFEAMLGHLASIEGAVFKPVPYVDLLQGDVPVPAKITDIEGLATEIIETIAERGSVKIPVTDFSIRESDYDPGYWPPVRVYLSSRAEPIGALIAEAQKLMVIGGKALYSVGPTGLRKPLFMKLGRLDISDKIAYQDSMRVKAPLIKATLPSEAMLSTMQRLL